MGESGCFPGPARVFNTWLTQRERNSAEGIKAASARWGAALTPALMAALYTFLNWRQVFCLFGLAGVVWGCCSFLSIATGRAPSPSRIETLHSCEKWFPRAVSGLGVQWFCHYYGFYFYITWLPIYLYQVRHLDLRQESLAAGLPLFAAGLGCIAAGWTLTALARLLGSTARARKLMGYGLWRSRLPAGAVYVDCKPFPGNRGNEPVELGR